MEIYKSTLYTCGCGYETLHQGNASRHKKVDCGQAMSSKLKEFVLKEDSDKMALETNIVNDCISIEEKDAIIKNQEDVIKRQRKSIMMLTETVVECDDDEKDNVGSGLIYFVEDVDIPDRGKIGRTKNTDIKKLKTRYATFASPKITCFYSNNINKDENDLKKLLRDAGCMASNNEKISNCDVAASIFLKFSRR
ncbi:protein of unknown function (DUF1390) [Paramecium bursaria Chlorella virus CZ-2]|nr:protein of unknown function (DUF1390) [Paramecium bursaria Chlorella virus CZ-2]